MSQKIQGEIVLDPHKITEYLLVWKPKNDKSGFLNKPGYTQGNWEVLREGHPDHSLLPKVRLFIRVRPRLVVICMR